MKVIISHSETVRLITGPFRICGSRDDLLRIADLLVKACHSHAEMDDEGVVREANMSYGWVSITDLPVEQEILADTRPIRWDARTQEVE